MKKKYPSIWRYYGLVFVAWAIYIFLTLIAQPTQQSQQLNLSEATVIILRISFLVPYMLTWLIAMLGWYYFRKFARDAKRKKIPSHIGFRYIARGIGLLVFDLILIPLIGSARNTFASNEAMAVATILLSNYLHILIPLVAFVFMYIGSRKLAQTGRYAVGLRSRILPSILATLLFATLFTIAIFSNTSRQVGAGEGQFASYYVSDPMIVLTIIVPIAVTWFLGLETALNTERYVHSLRQPRWRSAIIHFFHGLLAVVCSLIILQALAAFGNQQLLQVNLALLLSVLYLFLIVQAVGYQYVKNGAKQLRSLIRAGVPHETN
jgi:hypothetical protein